MPLPSHRRPLLAGFALLPPLLAGVTLLPTGGPASALPCASTIAGVQGTGAASPCVDQTVTVKGVVTAKYPLGQGQLQGIYIQTGGSGGQVDATPGASDGIFVYGSNSQPAGVAVGDSVEVTGKVTEFNGLTELMPAQGGVKELGQALPPVTPQAVVPGTSCALPGNNCLTGAALDQAREAHEGELFKPTGATTVTDVSDGSPYTGGSGSANFYGEIGLAAQSAIPLVAPTEVIDAQNTNAINARKAYNDAHRLVLDDGASITHWNTFDTGKTDVPLPWWTATNTVRVGAAATFHKPVVLEWRYDTWRLQPQVPVTDSGASQVSFQQDRPSKPAGVGGPEGTLKLGTFNVLNLFTTLGADYGGCTSYDDRLGNPVSVESCPGTGPRGAWNKENFSRQMIKIATAINRMDADIVALEELENSAIVDGQGQWRDEAISYLVNYLNSKYYAEFKIQGRWKYVAGPLAADPGEDVIRTGFIYNPAAIVPVGKPEIFYDAAFDDAREPLAQVFKPKLGGNPFAVIVNHFKSKGSGNPDPHGQGNANDRRILQAQALVQFAKDFSTSRNVARVFLTGDFNAYSEEDPIQVLRAAGYTDLKSTDNPNEESYNFDGMVGSLDHVFANAAALPSVTGVDVWTINSYESQYFQYSRHNYNVSNLFSPTPYRASDHNPELVGIDPLK